MNIEGFRKRLSRTWMVVFAGIVVFSTVALRLLLDTATIRIIPTGQNNSASQGVNVHISGIVKNNNDEYRLEAIKPEGWYTIWDTNIENYGDGSCPLVIRTRRYDSLQITFFNNPYMGIVEIETPAQSYRLDLYTPNEYGTTAVDIPFAASERAPWGLCLGIGSLCAIGAAGFLYFTVYAPPSKKKAAVSAAAGCLAAVLALYSGVDYGTRCNALFVLSYGAAMGLLLPNFVRQCSSLNRVSLPVLLCMSGYASVVSLYMQLVRPFHSFHFGLYGTLAFGVMLLYWLSLFFIGKKGLEKFVTAFVKNPAAP